VSEEMAGSKEKEEGWSGKERLIMFGTE